MNIYLNTMHNKNNNEEDNKFLFLFCAKISPEKGTNLSDKPVSIATLKFSMDATSFASLCFSAEARQNSRNTKHHTKQQSELYACMRYTYIMNNSRSIY